MRPDVFHDAGKYTEKHRKKGGGTGYPPRWQLWLYFVRFIC